MQDPNLNRKLGPYRLQRIVGRGGMGTVYAAQDESTGEFAAVKVLSPALASDESFRERFAAEIESLKKLQHPNIVRLTGFGEQDGHLFYVMELVEGNSLQEELRRGRRFTWREVSQIAIEICAALKHAHDHGIIHRDLKPANLLLTTDDQIKLFDFGIAKLFGSSQLTTGSVMGTAAYMAPEQGEGKPVGPRTDLYSLGSVMYALLVGKPPFSGQSIAEVVHKVRFDAPTPVCRLVNEVPVEMEHLIEQLLEKQPERRIPTALAVSHRLKAMEHALSVHSDDDSAVSADTDVFPVEQNEEEPQISDRPTIQLPHDLKAESERTHVTTDPSTTGGETHFTRVEASRESSPSLIPWQTIGMLLAFGFVATTIYFAVEQWRQPPTANSLYQKIVEKEDLEDDRWFLTVEREVKQFLELYPNDSRSKNVDEIKEMIDVDRLQRRLELQARRGKSFSLAIQQLYVAAVRRAETDLAGSTRDLHAILMLYQGKEKLSPEEQACLNLIQRRSAIQQSELEQQRETQLALIEERMRYAQQICKTDPDSAKSIYQGIVDLYADEKWAQALVDQARQAFLSLP